MKDSPPSVGFIGTGIMGRGMIRNLLKNKFRVHAFNRSREKLRELIELGIQAAESPAALRQETEVILVCVTDGSAVRAVLLGEDGVLQGEPGAGLVVDCSTIAPDEAIALSEALSESNIGFIDAPVSGGDVGAQGGSLSVMAGGSEENFRRALPFLQAIGKSIIHTGPVGSGQSTKCVNQVVVALTICALTEGMRLAEESGLDVNRTLEILTGGAASSWALENYGPRLLRQDYSPGFHAKDMLKDLGFALSQAEALGLELPATCLASELFQKLCELPEQEGPLGNHALIQHYRQVVKS